MGRNHSRFRIFGMGLVLPLVLSLSHAQSPGDTVLGEALELPHARVQGRKESEPAVTLKSDFIRKMPGAMNDPIRAVAYSPGVMVSSDFNARPFIRGGDGDQTQIVLNGLPLLQPYHVGGSFSLFNLSTLESVELHRDDFPVEYPGALSGILRLKNRLAPPPKPHAQIDASMIRGGVFAETPLPQTPLSLYAGAQTFLFNDILHGLLNGVSALSSDSAFRNDMQTYQNHINLPSFRDFHWGLGYAPQGDWRVNYFGGYSHDDYAVVVPAKTNIIGKPAPADNPIPVFPAPTSQEINRSKKLSIDSLSAVGIGNHAHFLNLAWDIHAHHYLEANAGLQWQKWDVSFKKDADLAEPLMLEQDSRLFSLRLVDAYTPVPGRQFKFGASFDYRFDRYRTEMPFVLYDVIVNSNGDMLSTLGAFSPKGFRIRKDDSTRTNFDYLGSYPARIRFSHRGWSEQRVFALFASHRIESSTGELSYGLRQEYDPEAGELFPAPRASYRWKLSETDALLFKAGLYTQYHAPFYVRDAHPSLLSEKSAEAGMKWEHRLAPGFAFSVDTYYKYYFDLIEAFLKPNGTLDLKSSFDALPNSALSEEQIQSLKGTLDSAKSLSALSDSVRQAAYETFGGLVFDYRNSGVGHSLGSEFSLEYQPYSAWSGWLSADFSLSYRRDREGEDFYPFQIHRPVVFNWVNRFEIPRNYELALTYRWAMGQPYTSYSGTMDEKGLGSIDVGARNEGRLAPYSRLDIRLSRNFRRWGGNFKTYIEVWNAMNEPNYFARDNETGQLKSAQLNFPFPVVFLGLSADF